MSVGADRGHTMAEVLTALVVVALLLSISTVGAGAVRKRSADSVAVEALERVVVAQQRFASVYGSFTPDPSDLTNLGQDLVAIDGRSSGPQAVSIAVGANGTLGVAVESSTGTCKARRIPAAHTPPPTPPSTAPEFGPVGIEADAVCEGAAALPDGEAPVTASPMW